jgi:hypothetical protein
VVFFLVVAEKQALPRRIQQSAEDEVMDTTSSEDPILRGSPEIGPKEWRIGCQSFLIHLQKRVTIPSQYANIVATLEASMMV